MKTLPEVLVEAQALASVSEDQFEASLAVLVNDIQALVSAASTAPTLVGVTATFSDGSSQSLPQS